MLKQQDAPRVIRRGLREVLSCPVRSELPSGWTPRDGPVVTVVSDGSDARHPAWDREVVRVVAYGESEPVARALAAEADEWLIDPRRPPGVLVTPAGGLALARDSSLGGWVASVTVVVSTPRR